jgi:type IV secretory pathway TrbL component
MKKIILGIALITVSSATFAEAPGGPNCGWGNMLMEGKSGTGSHIMASLTNGTSGNATFGMTTGTNGCSTSGTLTYSGASMVSSIMSEFSEDVARGQGDAMDTVAVIYGVEKQDRDTFAKVMHENFSTIFPSENVTAEEMMVSMETIMKADPVLSKYIA